MGDLNFDNVYQMHLGQLCSGRLRLRPVGLDFKNEVTNKSQHIMRADMVKAYWMIRAIGHCLRMQIKNEEMLYYDGFGELEVGKVNDFFKKHYDIDVGKLDLCYKGFNYGDVDFDGKVLQMKVKGTTSFEVPMDNVYNAQINKEEIILEFHQNDDARICVSEMRLFTPAIEGSTQSKSDILINKIKEKAGIVEVSGDSLVQFTELQCLQPRGRYDFKFYPSFIHLHGKSFDFKVPKSSFTRVMMLPHPDDRKMFFVVQVQPPLKHGQTSYHFIIVMLEKEHHVDVEVNASEKFLEEECNGKISSQMSGAEYEILAILYKALYKMKITTPNSFKSTDGAYALNCNHKASPGLLYPLDRSFMFVPRPAVYVRFEDIVSVRFSRGSSMLRSFDFEIELKDKTQYNFISIDKGEYDTLFDFVTSKGLPVQKTDSENTTNYNNMDDGFSSDESHDAYMQQVRNEAREHAAEDSDSTDEDFKPPGSDEESEVADEYDSNASTTESSGSESGKGDDSDNNAPKRPSKPKAEKPSKSKTASGPPKERKKKKKEKDPNKPTRPQSAYFLWLNENRQKIAEKAGAGASVTEIAKKAGEIWKEMDADSKAKYQEEFLESKKVYDVKMAEYKKNFGDTEKVSKPKAKAAAPSSGGGGFKSSEFVDDDSDSSLSS